MEQQSFDFDGTSKGEGVVDTTAKIKQPAKDVQYVESTTGQYMSSLYNQPNDSPCPHCGYCRHCGRSNTHGNYPYHIWNTASNLPR